MSVAPFTKVGSQLLVDGAMYTETGGVVLADTGAPCAVTVGPVVAPFDEAEYFATQVRAVLRKYGANAHVWMPGQGVPVLGVERVVNGDFSNGTTGWDKSSATTISVVNGRLRAALANSNNQRFYQTINGLTIGARYQVSANLYRGTTTGSNTVFFRVSDTANVTSSVPFEQQSGTGDFTVSSSFVATTSTVYVGCVAIETTIGAYFEIDNISIKEITGYSTLLNGFQAANYLEANASGAPQVVDQPVGYVGDAANVTLGPELVTNGDFSAGATNWTPGSNWQLSGNEMLSLGTGGTYLSTQGANLITAGKTYLCRFEIKTQTVAGGGVSIGIGTGTAGPVISSGPGVYTCTLTAGANGYVFLTARGSGPFWQGTVDNVSVKEIVGAIPATQSATSNKPFLRRGHVNRLINSGDLGATGWTRTDITVTKNQDGPDGTPNSACLVTQGVAGTSTVVQNYNVASGGVYTDTWIIKRGNTDWVRFTNNTTAGDGGQFWVNLATGTVGGSSTVGVGSNLSISIEPMTNGFYKVAITATPNGAGTVKAVQCYAVTANNVVTRVNNGTFIVAGVQSEVGTVSNSYVPTTTAAASSNTGGYWWEFDGTDDTLTMAAPLFQVNDDMAVITGVTMSRLTSNARIFSQWGAGASFFRLYVDQATRNVFAAWTDDSAAGVVPASPGQLNYGVPAVLSAVKSGAGRYARKDGVAGSTAGNVLSGASSLTSAAICSQAGGAYFVGSVFSTIVIKGTVSGADLKILEKWVGQQAGVQIA